LRPLEDGERAPTPTLVSALLRAVNRLRRVAAEHAEGVEDEAHIDELLEKLEAETARPSAHGSDELRATRPSPRPTAASPAGDVAPSGPALTPALTGQIGRAHV